MEGDLLGAPPILARLKRAHDQGRLAHAYLFAGPEGLGKRLLARRVARGLLCREAPSLDSCGVCRACKAFEAGLHPDAFSLEPPEKKARIAVEDARAATQSMALKNTSGSRKVLVVRDAERMTDEAMNALLKLVEEPRGDALILLTTSAPEQILPTIRSRCQAVHFPLRPVAEIRSWLGARGKDAADARLAALLSGGSPGRALALLEDAAIFEGREGLIRRALQPGIDGTAALADEIVSEAKGLHKDETSAQRDHVKRRLALLLLALRDLLVLSSGASSGLFHEDQGGLLAGIAGRITPDEAVLAIETVGRAMRDIDGNANLSLVTEHTLRSIGEG